MADDTAEEASGLDRTKKLVDIFTGLACAAVLVWQLYDLTKDDPLGPAGQVRWWWSQRQREQERRRRERLEVVGWALDLVLYLEREVDRWASKSM